MSQSLVALDAFEQRLNWIPLGALMAIGLGFAIGVPVPIGALGVMLAAAISFISPEGALGGCLAATPFIARPVEIGSGSWTLLELMLIAGAIGVGGRICAEAASGRTRAPFVELLPTPGIVVGAALLVGLAALAMTNLADPEHRDASMRAVRTIMIEPLAIIVISRRVLVRGRMELPLAALAATMVACVGWGALDVLRGTGVDADGVRRAIGPYTHPNNLAFFLERAALLTAVPLMLRERSRRYGIALLGIGIFGVLLTFSRGALLALPAGLVVALWLSGRLRAIAGVAAGLVAAAGVLALFAGDRLFDAGGESGEPSRVVLWDGAERILRDFPITGIGPDQFFVMYGLRYIEPVGWPERYTSHPHNLFLDFWLSLGIGGLCLAIVAVGWVAWRIVRLRRANNREEEVEPFANWPLAVGGAAAMTAAVVHGLVDNSFFLPDLAVLTWFALVLLTSKQVVVET